MHVSWKGAAATLAAAATLVVGIDAATYAATGDSLILGRQNTASRTTAIITDGPGAALSLQSTGDDKPSLRVSSSAKVKSLNADTVDGRNAADLATTAVTYRAGSAGDTIVGGFGLWSMAVDPGLYAVSFSALTYPDVAQGDPPVSMICGIIDLETLQQQRTRVYVGDSATFLNDGQGAPMAMSGAETVRVKPGQSPGLICVTPGVDYTLYKQIVASVTPIDHRKLATADPVNLGPGQQPRSGLGLG